MSCARELDSAQGFAVDGDALSASALITIFDECFAHSERTRLIGGGEEPEYFAAKEGSPARVQFRHDYASSALHEIAHWCIAGRERRKLADYGYWYAPDGRTAAQQAWFLAVECKPQALECLFSRAAGQVFHLSMDNLDAPPNHSDCLAFASAVADAINAYLQNGLPRRARIFVEALHAANPAHCDSNDMPVLAAQLL